MNMRDDDYASMLAVLDGRLTREDIATALGVEEQRLDEIASGYVPDPDVAERLRALAGTKPDRAIFRSRRILVVAFVVADLVFFAIVAALVLLR